MDKIRIGLVQMEAESFNMEANLAKIAAFTEQASKNKAKILCFPELSTCGYDRSIFTKTAQNIQGYTTEYLLALADKYQILILAGMIEKEQDRFYITQVAAFPDGKIEKYRKTHLGTYEKTICTPGNELPVFDMKQNNEIYFGMGICYDFHFSEVTAILSLQGAQIIFAPHASPIKANRRVELWNKYLCARAYDHRVYIAACNLTQKSKEGKFGGGMAIWDPFGNLIDAYTQQEENILFCDLDITECNHIRKGKQPMRNPYYLKDRRMDLYARYMSR
jgi:predicted amidohydrolase